MSLVDELLSRRIAILLGKGGVGKTAISAALAEVSARRHRQTLVVECDERAPLGSLFGREPSFEPMPVGDNLFTGVIEGRHALEEYLRLVVPARAVLNAVFSSKLYQYFVQAAPGLRELMILGKLYYEIQRKPGDGEQWENIIFDAPSSGQALSIVKMPTVARETFGDSVVGREAQNIAGMLRDAKITAVVLVTTPEPLALSEALETHAELKRIGVEVAAVILSRYKPRRFAARDVDRLFRMPRVRESVKNLEYLRAVADEELRKASAAEEARKQLNERTGSRILRLPEHKGLSGQELVSALASDLESETSEAAVASAPSAQ